MKTLFVKYSTLRNDQYQIITTILRDNDNKLCIRKEPLGLASYEHMDQIYRNAVQISEQQQVFIVPDFKYKDHIFEMAYAQGDTLEEEMHFLLDYKRYAEFEAKWKEYRDLLKRMPQTVCNPAENDNFLSMFGKVDQEFSCIKIGHIDLITENIIRSSDGTLWNIDPEWIIDMPIPVDFVLYRAVITFYNRFNSLLSAKYSVDDLLDVLNVSCYKNLFSEWESKFSDMIYNTSIFELQKKYFVPAADFNMWSQHIPSVYVSSLYYGNENDFSQDRCLYAEVVKDRKVHISFIFPEPTNIESLRWDPCNGVFSTLSNCRIELKLDGKIVKSIDSYETNGSLMGDKYVFATTNPQVRISILDQITFNEVTVNAEIEMVPYHELETKIFGSLNQRIGSLLQENQDVKNEFIDMQGIQAKIIDSLNQRIDTLLQENQNAKNELYCLQDKLTQSHSHLFSVIKNPLTAWRPVRLTPKSGIDKTADGTYLVSGANPQINLDSSFSKGLYLFTWDGSSTRRTQLKLYSNYGRGFNEVDSQVLGYINREFGHHERFIRFKKNVLESCLDLGDTEASTIRLLDFHYVRLSLFSGIRVGLALITRKTGFNKFRLLVHFTKLCLQGKKNEAASHFAAVFKDHGDGHIAGDDVEAYVQYISECEPNEAQLKSQVKAARYFSLKPLISIVVPVYNTDKQMLIDMIESVRGQTYAKWELCLADGHSSKDHVAEVLNQYASIDKRIKVTLLEDNFGIVGNTNAALDLAEGDYISLLDHDDLLAPWALFSIVKAINSNHAPDVLYSDEDKITFDGGRRFQPHFKPDWSPDLLNSCNYITHLFTAKRDLINRVGKFLPGFDGSQDFDLILRATEKADKIIHIPEILYHWRSHSESTAESAGNKLYAYEAGSRAITAHLNRIGYEGTVMNSEYLGFYKTNYKLIGDPLVSIIIPNSEHLSDLRRCLDSIYKLSTYKNFEIIIIENNSTTKSIFAYYDQLQKKHGVNILKWDGEFNFSAINNYAVQFAKGEMLLFLNNDTEVISPDWIEQMLQHAQRKDVGAVGAKLYYADDTIQHGGVVLGFKGIAGHSFSRLPKSNPGYMGRGIVVQNVSAVTAACMMISRKTFEEIDGFDESLKIAFNDIDLCMKIRKSGKLIIFNPDVELYHHESTSRGAEETLQKMERFGSEIDYFKSKWMEQLAAGDPYYNPHLDLEKVPYRISGK